MKALLENITLQNDGELEYSSDDLVYFTDCSDGSVSEQGCDVGLKIDWIIPWSRSKTL